MHPRHLTAPLFVLVLGLTLLGSALAPAGHGPSDAVASIDSQTSAAKKASNSPVIAPRPRQVLKSNTVLLHVRSSDHSGRLAARLNGVRIDEEFSRARKGVRTMRVSVSHGLRRGKNVLKVKVLRHGLSTRRATVRFSLRRKQALVGAGRDRRVVVGSRVRLGGEVRIIPKTSGKSRPGWRIVKGPSKKKPAGLLAPRRAGSGFKPARLGTYILELRHRRGKVLTTDRVKLDVVPANPMVPIETLPKAGADGTFGIKVGNQTYPPKDGNAWIQVLVLKRKTLALVANGSFNDDAGVGEFLQGFDDTNLVIVTRPTEGSHTGFLGFDDSLNRIGIPNLNKLAWNPYYAAPQAGEFSGIGVPGMKVGSGDYRIAMEDSRDPHLPGDMRGYLVPDQYRNYGYVAAESKEFTFGRKETLPGDPRVGYRVGVYDTHSLLPWFGDGAVFNTNGPGLSAAQKIAEAQRMTKALNDIGGRNVVTIQTVSSRSPGETNYLPPIGAIDKATMAALATAVERVGGSANAFNRAATVSGVPESGGAVYSLIGWEQAKRGQAAEVAAGVGHAGDAPVISTVLRPDHQSMFRPTEVVGSAGGQAALSELSLKTPTSAWPLDDVPGAKRAIAYLGSQDEELGPDPRSAYWTQKLDTDALIRVLTATTYPAGKDFTEAEFDTAKAQLIKELGWVGKVRRYLGQLSTPFADNALPSWEASKAIADKIYDEAHASDSKVTFNWFEFTEALIGLIPLAGQEAESGLETVATLLEFGMRTYGAVDQGGEATDRDVEIESTKLGAELLAESQRMQASIQSMGDVIVSDYAKLSALGPHAGCNVKDPDCPKEFAYSLADRADASANVYRGIERVAYEKLLPLGYDVYVSRQVNSTTEPDPRAYFCADASLTYPWANYPNPAQNATRMLTELDPVAGKHSWVFYTIATPRPGTPAAPSNETFDRLFHPISSGDPKDGGLGMTYGDLIPEHPAYLTGLKENEEDLCDADM